MKTTDAARRTLFDDVFDNFSMLVGKNYVTLYDAREQLTRYSPAIVDMVGLPGEYIKDGVYDWTAHIHPDDRTSYERAMEELIAGRQLTYDLSYRVRLKDGSYNMFRLVGGVIRDEDGCASIIGGTMINEGLTENTDRVTVMRNQNGFFDDLLELDRGKHTYTVLLVGFGRLSHINEVYGYGYGNQLLKEVGRVVAEAAGEGRRTYRMEGSKFAVLAEDATAAEMAELYRKIRHALKSGVTAEGVQHNLVAYGGVMTLANDEDSSGRTSYICLRHAYNESKKYRHGELVAFNGSNVAEPQVIGSVSMINAIREGMLHDYSGFSLLYQPIFRPFTDKPIGAEALLRWKGDEYGRVLPPSFLAEIENDYAFEGLGYWILRNAMNDGRLFLDADPDFFLCVNVSPSQLSDAYFSSNVADLAEQTGFRVERLGIELNRECRLHHPDTLKAFADALRGKGVRVGIDDFARGNAWLKTFGEIEPDYVKFSNGLVRNLGGSEKDRVIIRSLSEMTAACGAEVYVKGIETREMLEGLRGLPIRGAQGELLSGPIYFDEILDRL